MLTMAPADRVARQARLVLEQARACPRRKPLRNIISRAW
jgi:hypothetical protein